MSIFDNIRNKPQSSTEIDLLIKLKYGDPTPTDEYFEKLPEVVIRRASQSMSPNHRRYLLETDIQVLGIMLMQPANKEKALQAIHTALVEYHTLLG